MVMSSEISGIRRAIELTLTGTQLPTTLARSPGFWRLPAANEAQKSRRQKIPGTRLILNFDRLMVEFLYRFIGRGDVGIAAKKTDAHGDVRMKYRRVVTVVDRAERFRPILGELAALPAAAAAATLNERDVPSPRGGRWYAVQVIRMRKRLAAGPHRKTRKWLLERDCPDVSTGLRNVETADGSAAI
jgi:hypothetical protein